MHLDGPITENRNARAGRNFLGLLNFVFCKFAPRILLGAGCSRSRTNRQSGNPSHLFPIILSNDFPGVRKFLVLAGFFVLREELHCDVAKSLYAPVPPQSASRKEISFLEGSHERVRQGRDVDCRPPPCLPRRPREWLAVQAS